MAKEMSLLWLMVTFLTTAAYADKYSKQYMCTVGDSRSKFGVNPYAALESYVPLHLCTHVIHSYTPYCIGMCRTYPTLSMEFSEVLHSGEAMAAVKRLDPNTKLLLQLRLNVVSLWSGCQGYPDNDGETTINDLKAYINPDNLDGYDVYWMGPTSDCLAENMERFDLFIAELRTSFPDKVITVTVTPDPDVVPSYNLQHIANNADLVSATTYDYHTHLDGVTGYHAPLFSKSSEPSVDASLQLLLTSGVPKEKLVMGVSVRAQTYHLVDPAVNDIGAAVTGPASNWSPFGKPGIYEQYEACGILNKYPELLNHTDQFYHSTYFYFGSVDLIWFSYLTPEDLFANGLYASSNHLAGVSLWTFNVYQLQAQFERCFDLTGFEELNRGLRACPRTASRLLAN